MKNDLTSEKSALEKAIEDRLAYEQENGQLKDEVTSLKNRIAWFENQIFGQKSEKRIIDNPHQASLLCEPTETEVEAAPKEDVGGYQRGTAKKTRPSARPTAAYASAMKCRLKKLMSCLPNSRDPKPTSTK